MRFVRQRSFYQVPIQRRLQVVFAEGGPVGKPRLLHARQRGEWSISQALEQRFYLVANLAGGCGLIQRCQQSGEHEFNESGGLPSLVGGPRHRVILCLPFRG